MQQLEIQYFFPLTEQIPLDLDYTHCDKPKLYTSTIISNGGIGTSWVPAQTIAFMPTNDSAGYWEVGQGLQMHNKKKPNWLHQQMSKIFFGWKWKDK